MELLLKYFTKRELLWLLLLFYSTPFKFVQGGVTQIPSHACVGEKITIHCEVSVPDPNSNFRVDFIEFIVGSSDASISDAEVNTGTSVHGGVNLTRLTAFANNSFSDDKIIRGSLTLSSYTASDTGIRLGCAAVYYLSGNDGATDVIRETTPLRPAAPPPAPSMLSISTSNIDPSTCSATVSLNWIPPSSTDRTVDLYYLSLQNGTALESISAPANSYSHNTDLLLDTVYAYSVHASSCAGNSTVATSHLNPNDPPSPPNNIQNSVSNFNTATCSADVSLSWNTPPSDITVNRYFLYLDGSPLATTNSNSYIHSTILNINTTYQYSVTAMSCAGNSTNSSTNVNYVPIVPPATETTTEALLPAILGSISAVLVIIIIVIIIIICVIIYIYYKKMDSRKEDV